MSVGLGNTNISWRPAIPQQYPTDNNPVIPEPIPSVRRKWRLTFGHNNYLPFRSWKESPTTEYSPTNQPGVDDGISSQPRSLSPPFKFWTMYDVWSVMAGTDLLFGLVVGLFKIKLKSTSTEKKDSKRERRVFVKSLVVSLLSLLGALPQFAGVGSCCVVTRWGPLLGLCFSAREVQ